MLHHARRHQFRCRIDHASEHALSGNVTANPAGRVDALQLRALEPATVLVEVPVGDAVLHRHHHRVGAEQAQHLPGHRLDLVRLHRQDDDVLRARLLVVVGGNHVAGDATLAIRLHQREAIVADRLEIRAAHHEGHVLTGKRKTSAHQATDGASANYCYLHFRLLKLNA